MDGSSSLTITFLRAINVGGRFVKMDVLRGLFGELGFDDVQTYIQSGNVIFRAPERPRAELERRIEAHLAQGLGYDVAAFARSASELAAIAARDPFAGVITEEGATRYVVFLRQAPDPERQQRLLALAGETDLFHFQGAELHWLWHRARGEGVVTPAKVESLLGMAGTRRNLNTVRKMAAKYLGK